MTYLQNRTAKKIIILGTLLLIIIIGRFLLLFFEDKISHKTPKKTPNEPVDAVNAQTYWENYIKTHNKAKNIDLGDKKLTGPLKITEDIPTLQTLKLWDNKISAFEISINLPKLQRIYLSRNNLTSINLSKSTKLKTLLLSGNNLTSVNLSEINPLEHIGLSYNNLTSIYLPKNNQIKSLILANNKLRKINLVKLTQLKYLDVSDNEFLAEIILNNIYKYNDLNDGTCPNDKKLDFIGDCKTIIYSIVKV